MKRILVSVLGTLVVLFLLAFVVMLLGAYNVGTGNHDNALMNWFLDAGMTSSVRFHARGIHPPALGDPAQVEVGAAHYREMCAMCHGAPGVAPGEIAEGLWPPAPRLGKDGLDWTEPQLFWIVKNGLKFTAMPAWGPSHSDEKIWAIVAFLQKLPRLSPAEYEALVAKAGPEENGDSEESPHHGNDED